MWLELINIASELERKRDRRYKMFAVLLRKIAEVLKEYEEVSFLGKSEDRMLSKIGEILDRYGQNDKAGFILNEIKKLLKEIE